MCHCGQVSVTEAPELAPTFSGLDGRSTIWDGKITTKVPRCPITQVEPGY